MKKIEVVAGILIYKDKFLCVQRPKNRLPYISKKFEFPGGKIEKGETQKQALKRELSEELNIIISEATFFMTNIHEYPDFELTMHSFKCDVDSQDIDLTEHISLEWLGVSELTNLDWAAADVPIVQKLIADGRIE